MNKKVAIIGAGVSGIILARELLQKNIDITIFEETPYYGGQWNYNSASECIDIRKKQSVLSSAMYDCMRTNFPITMMQMPGLDYPDGTPTFPSHRKVFSYIKSYVAKFGLEQYIKYNQEVININKKTSGWTITTKEDAFGDFSYVAICTGKERFPYIPKLTGMETFSGIIAHSNSYRTADIFKDKNVVVLGASYSGQEISTDISNTAKNVYFCGKFTQHNYSCPKKNVSYGKYNNIKQYPCIDSILATSIKLKNGETPNQVDAIVLCTGYHYSFPFLQGITADIQTSGNYVGPLYLDIFYPKDPSLMFIGLLKGASHFYVASLQAAYCAEVISSEASLPDYETMLSAIHKHSKSLKNSGLGKGQFFNYKSRQYAYHQLLCDLANIKYNGGIHHLRTAFAAHKKRYQDNYRDQPFVPDA